MPGHLERHYAERIGWLRAAVLGANDGIVSTASLVLGVAAGEYVSVSSQADTEKADLEREKRELATEPESELMELTGIYMKRGLDEPLARKVAIKFTEFDALSSHARDELGLTEIHTARPIQAALASAATFAVGAAMPLLLVVLSPVKSVIPIVTGGSLVFLAIMGGSAARTGGANIWKGASRVTFWGLLAMAITMGIGKLFGSVVQ